MASAITLIGDAIALALDTDQVNRWGCEFETIQSGGDFDLELQDQDAPYETDVLQVDQVAVDDDMEMRAGLDENDDCDIIHVCTYQIFVRQKLTKRVERTGRLEFGPVQDLTDMVTAISTFFTGYTLPTLPEAEHTESSVEAIRVRSTLRTNSQFTGISRITYRLTTRRLG